MINAHLLLAWDCILSLVLAYQYHIWRLKSELLGVADFTVATFLI